MTLEEIMKKEEYKEIDKKLVFSGILLCISTVLLVVMFMVAKVLFVFDLVVEVILLVIVGKNWYAEMKYINDNIDKVNNME